MVSKDLFTPTVISIKAFTPSVNISLNTSVRNKIGSGLIEKRKRWHQSWRLVWTRLKACVTSVSNACHLHRNLAQFPSLLWSFSNSIEFSICRLCHERRNTRRIYWRKLLTRPWHTSDRCDKQTHNGLKSFTWSSLMIWVPKPPRALSV